MGFGSSFLANGRGKVVKAVGIVLASVAITTGIVMSTAKTQAKIDKYIDDKDSLALSNYKILERQIDPLYLYPMPKGVVGKEEEYALESNFMAKQKAILKKAYQI